jgi:hypothetical protein
LDQFFDDIFFPVKTLVFNNIKIPYPTTVLGIFSTKKNTLQHLNLKKMLTKKEKHAYARRQKVRRRQVQKRAVDKTKQPRELATTLSMVQRRRKNRNMSKPHEKQQMQNLGATTPELQPSKTKGKKTTQAPAGIEPVTHGGRAAQRGKSSVLLVLHADSPRQNRQVLMHAAQGRGRPPAAPPLLKMQDLPA